MQINFHLPEACAAGSEEKRERTGAGGEERKEPPLHQPAVRIWLQPSLEWLKRGTTRAREGERGKLGPGMNPQPPGGERKAWAEKNKLLLAASLTSGPGAAGEAGKMLKTCPLRRCFAGGWRLRLLGAPREPKTDPKDANEGRVSPRRGGCRTPSCISTMLGAPPYRCGGDICRAGDNQNRERVAEGGRAGGERRRQDQGRSAALPSLPSPAAVADPSALFLCRNPPFSGKSANVAVKRHPQGQLEPRGALKGTAGGSSQPSFGIWVLPTLLG